MSEQVANKLTMLTVTALDHFVLRVRNLDTSLAFYRDVLGLPIQFLEEYRAGQRPFVSVRIGSQLLDLVPDSTFDPEAGKTAGGFLHFCVGVPAGTLERTVPWLKEREVNVLEDQPMPRMGATGIGLSVYITDPDGYVVELKEHAS